MVSCNRRYKGLITTTPMVYFEPPAELLHWFDVANEIENHD